MFTLIRLLNCIGQIEKLLYKKQVDKKTIEKARLLIEKGVKLSEKKTWRGKSKKEGFREHVEKFLSPSNDRKMAWHWVRISQKPSKDAMNWYRSAMLKTKLYESLKSRVEWLESPALNKEIEGAMDFEKVVNLETAGKTNPYKEEIKKIDNIHVKRVQKAKESGEGGKLIQFPIEEKEKALIKTGTYERA